MLKSRCPACVLRRRSRNLWTAPNGLWPCAPWTDRGTGTQRWTQCWTQYWGLLTSGDSAVNASHLLRLSLGDWADPLPLAEVSWPLVYGAAVDLLGSDLVHRYVGVDGYSAYSSPFTLTKTGPVQLSA